MHPNAALPPTDAHMGGSRALPLQRDFRTHVFISCMCHGRSARVSAVWCACFARAGAPASDHAQALEHCDSEHGTIRAACMVSISEFVRLCAKSNWRIEQVAQVQEIGFRFLACRQLTYPDLVCLPALQRAFPSARFEMLAESCASAHLPCKLFSVACREVALALRLGAARCVSVKAKAINIWQPQPIGGTTNCGR